MHLLKIGDTTLNMDRVNHIDDNDNQMTITFDNSVTFPAGSITINDEHEVQLFRRWLNLHAEDVSEAAEDSTGAPLGPPRSYVSPR